MSAVKPILRELREAALKGGVHARDKLHQFTNNVGDHLDVVVRQVRDKDKFDDTVDVSVKEFKKNKNHNSDTYDYQYNEQMDALQNISVADWLRNRIEFLDKGRTPTSVRAQQDARDIALRNRFKELLRKDPTRDYDQAMQEARDWLSTQAATHRLDGVAGGSMTDVSGVGDAKVNSSLGSQWRSRVGDLDRAVIDYINANPGVDLENIGISLTFR